MKDNHKRFADKYFETLNASESALFAGFSVDSAKQLGYQLLQREDIQDYLTELRMIYAVRSGITKDWIIQRFKEISDNCVKPEKFDSAGANKATEMLGKIIGIFEKDNTQKTPVKIGKDLADETYC